MTLLGPARLSSEEHNAIQTQCDSEGAAGEVHYMAVDPIGNDDDTQQTLL